MSKNKHNESVWSEVVRSDERIAETGEVFTPAELCDQMVSEIPESIVKDPNSTFLDNSAGILFLGRPVSVFKNIILYSISTTICSTVWNLWRIIMLNCVIDWRFRLLIPILSANALEYDYSFGKMSRGLGVYVTVWRVSQGVSDVGMVYPIIWRYQTEQTMTNNIESIHELNQVDHIMALCESYVEADQLEDVGIICIVLFMKNIDALTRIPCLWITLGQLDI